MALKSSNASTARVESSFKQLSTAAQTLHAASDDLRKVIRQLDASLKKLGLGFPAWVQISGSSDETTYWNRDLGYARVGGKWGLALRDVTGNHIDHDDDSEEVWAFNDAPRAMRIEAVGKIPDLLERLLQQTEETTKKLQSKIAMAADLAAVFADMTGGAPALPAYRTSQPRRRTRDRRERCGEADIPSLSRECGACGITTGRAPFLGRESCFRRVSPSGRASAPS